MWKLLKKKKKNTHKPRAAEKCKSQTKITITSLLSAKKKNTFTLESDNLHRVTLVSQHCVQPRPWAEVLLVWGAEGRQVKFSEGWVIFTALPDYSSYGRPWVPVPSSTHHHHRPLRLFSVLQPCRYQCRASFTTDTDRTLDDITSLSHLICHKHLALLHQPQR